MTQSDCLIFALAETEEKKEQWLTMELIILNDYSEGYVHWKKHLPNRINKEMQSKGFYFPGLEMKYFRWNEMKFLVNTFSFTPAF